jgi:hypothetical protein
MQKLPCILDEPLLLTFKPISVDAGCVNKVRFIPLLVHVISKQPNHHVVAIAQVSDELRVRFVDIQSLGCVYAKPKALKEGSAGSVMLSDKANKGVRDHTRISQFTLEPGIHVPILA